MASQSGFENILCIFHWWHAWSTTGCRLPVVLIWNINDNVFNVPSRAVFLLVLFPCVAWSFLPSLTWWIHFFNWRRNTGVCECVFVSGLSFGVFISTAVSECELEELCRWTGLHAWQPRVAALGISNDQHMAGGLVKNWPVCSAVIPTNYKRCVFYQVLVPLLFASISCSWCSWSCVYFIKYLKQGVTFKKCIDMN